MTERKKMSQLSTIEIAKKNLRQRPFRSLLLFLLSIVLSVSLLGGTLLATGLIRGLASTKNRLGAEVMIVPLEAQQDVEGVLLRGEPSAFYIEEDKVRELLQEQDIDQVSTQLYIASFSSSHCSFETQLIGYDPATDFVISPWLPNEEVNGPEDGQVLVGSSISRKAGDEIEIFGRTHTVAAKLDETGMGFDTSVFLNMETARLALKDYASYEEAEYVPPGEGVECPPIFVPVEELVLI
ncbi:MAG: ABC transporter permease [Lachnospiraceae bacterium]